MIPANQSWWASCIAYDTGFPTSSFVYLTIPVKIAATAIYRTVVIDKVPKIPAGIERFGFLTSAADEAITSNPK